MFSRNIIIIVIVFFLVAMTLDSHRAMPADRVIRTAPTSQAHLDMMNSLSCAAVMAAVMADTFSNTRCAATG